MNTHRSHSLERISIHSHVSQSNLIRRYKSTSIINEFRCGPLLYQAYSISELAFEQSAARQVRRLLKTHSLCPSSLLMRCTEILFQISLYPILLLSISILILNNIESSSSKYFLFERERLTRETRNEID